jgi:hypothetical protein
LQCLVYIYSPPRDNHPSIATRRAALAHSRRCIFGVVTLRQSRVGGISRDTRVGSWDVQARLSVSDALHTLLLSCRQLNISGESCGSWVRVWGGDVGGERGKLAMTQGESPPYHRQSVGQDMSLLRSTYHTVMLYYISNIYSYVYELYSSCDFKQAHHRTA